MSHYYQNNAYTFSYINLGFSFPPPHYIYVKKLSYTHNVFLFRETFNCFMHLLI